MREETQNTNSQKSLKHSTVLEEMNLVSDVMKASVDILTTLGIAGIQLQSAANKLTESKTGVNVLADAGVTLITENRVLKPIMGWLNIKSTREAGKVNEQLKSKGYLEGEPRNWTLTEKGKSFGAVMTYKNATGGGTQVCNIEWPEAVLELLK